MIDRLLFHHCAILGEFFNLPLLGDEGLVQLTHEGKTLYTLSDSDHILHEIAHGLLCDVLYKTPPHQLANTVTQTLNALPEIEQAQHEVCALAASYAITSRFVPEGCGGIWFLDYTALGQKARSKIHGNMADWKPLVRDVTLHLERLIYATTEKNDHGRDGTWFLRTERAWAERATNRSLVRT